MPSNKQITIDGITKYRLKVNKKGNKNAIMLSISGNPKYKREIKKGITKIDEPLKAHLNKKDKIKVDKKRNNRL